MQFLRMTSLEHDELLSRLAQMPEFLQAVFADLSASDVLLPGPDGSFSPVEQCWHLADLERDGYAVRIRRLLSEAEPVLPDFDGARVAKERRYQTLSIAAGIQAFRVARAANLATLRSIKMDEWLRAGIQEGVGAVALCDLPTMMAAHDAGHRQEIEGWSGMRRGNAGPNG